jgi:uncharacterized protein (DUF2236 family)
MVTMAEISREGILLAGGGRAILLQIAHPAVGAGVVNHSNFQSDPLKRLHGTLSYIYAIASGTPADAAAMRRAVNRAHAPVRGPGYNAMDPSLQLWVAATLYDSAMIVYERVFGALSAEDADRIYREYSVLGTALQMPEDAWPANRDAFAEYFTAQIAELSVDESVARVQRTLLDRATLPSLLRPLSPVVRAATTALLPSRVRALYGLAWTPEADARFERVAARVGRVYRLVPRGIRSAPQRYYLRRLRKGAALS